MGTLGVAEVFTVLAGLTESFVREKPNKLQAQLSSQFSAG